MRKKTTYVFNIILMIVVLIFTFYTLLHGEDLCGPSVFYYLS